MGQELRDGFRFGAWRAYPLRNVLVGPDGEVHLEPKVMQVLEMLASSGGDVAERTELLDVLWSGRAMSDEPLNRCIATLRRVLDDSVKEPEYIQTIPKRGYRFVCPVAPLAADAPEQLPGRPAERFGAWAVLAALSLVLIAAAVYRFAGPGAGESAEAPRSTEDSAARNVPPVQSIAVLPFANLSPEPGNGYLSDGLAAEVLNQLTLIPELKVAARTSAFAFKGRDIDATEIARQLRVNYLVTGSVRQSDDRLRVAVQLVDARDGYHVWSRTFERPFSDVFEIQDEIASSVVASLPVTLAGNLPEAARADPEAYKLLLKSKDLYADEGEPDVGELRPGWLEESYSLAMQSIAIDPDYAPAWSHLGWVQYNIAQWKRDFPGDEFERARNYAERALAIDPGDRNAMALLATVDFLWERDVESAALWYRRALDAGPGDPVTLARIGWMYSKLDREPPAFVRNTIEVEPPRVSARLNESYDLFKAGRINEAEAVLESVREEAPESVRLQAMGGLYAYALGDYERAARLAEPVNPIIRLCALHQLGREDEVRAGIEDLLASDGRIELAVATIHACRGDRDSAFEWLDRAYEEHEYRMIDLRQDTLLESLADDPRWPALLDRIGLSDDVADRVDEILRASADTEAASTRPDL